MRRIKDKLKLRRRKKFIRDFEKIFKVSKYQIAELENINKLNYISSKITGFIKNVFYSKIVN